MIDDSWQFDKMVMAGDLVSIAWHLRQGCAEGLTVQVDTVENSPNLRRYRIYGRPVETHSLEESSMEQVAQLKVLCVTNCPYLMSSGLGKTESIISLPRYPFGGTQTWYALRRQATLGYLSWTNLYLTGMSYMSLYCHVSYDSYESSLCRFCKSGKSQSLALC